MIQTNLVLISFLAMYLVACAQSPLASRPSEKSNKQGENAPDVPRIDSLVMIQPQPHQTGGTRWRGVSKISATDAHSQLGRPIPR